MISDILIKSVQEMEKELKESGDKYSPDQTKKIKAIMQVMITHAENYTNPGISYKDLLNDLEGVSYNGIRENNMVDQATD